MAKKRRSPEPKIGAVNEALDSIVGWVTPEYIESSEGFASVLQSIRNDFKILERNAGRIPRTKQGAITKEVAALILRKRDEAMAKIKEIENKIEELQAQIPEAVDEMTTVALLNVDYLVSVENQYDKEEAA